MGVVSAIFAVILMLTTAAHLSGMDNLPDGASRNEAAPYHGPQGGVGLRVATFNIRLSCLPADTQTRSWAIRATNVINEIKKANPDVIGIQEASNNRTAEDKGLMPQANHDDPKCVVGIGESSQLTDFASRLAKIGYHEAPAEGGERISDHIFYNGSTVEATTTPAVLYALHGGDAYLTVATLKMKNPESHNFAFATTHLIDPGQTPDPSDVTDCNSTITLETQEAMGLLNSYYRSDPVIFAGDFNSPQTGTCTSYAKVTTGNNHTVRALYDAQIHSLAVNDNYQTTNGWKAPVISHTALDYRYDRIFVSDDITVASWVNQLPTVIGQTSDHNLIYADVFI